MAHFNAEIDLHIDIAINVDIDINIDMMSYNFCEQTWCRVRWRTVSAAEILT